MISSHSQIACPRSMMVWLGTLLGLLEATSASFDRAFATPRSLQASQVNISFQ